MLTIPQLPHIKRTEVVSSAIVSMVGECQSDAYTIEDLYDLVFPPDVDAEGHLCMVFQCFLDDSKDQRQDKVFVSAGFFGRREDWEQLRSSWAKCLNRNGLEYFKTNEYKMLEGQFSRFKTAAYPAPIGRQKASAIRDELLAIPRRFRGIKGIGIVIPVEDYERVCARPEGNDFFAAKSYRRALEGVFDLMARSVETLPGKHVVAYVHDSGSDFDELRSYYEEYKVLNPRHAKYMGAFVPLDDKQHPPLQMADAIANYMQGKGVQWLQSRETIREVVPFNVHHMGVWTEHFMLSILKRNLMRLGRPIPEDLQSDEYG
jgi:hypothetical protein